MTKANRRRWAALITRAAYLTQFLRNAPLNRPKGYATISSGKGEKPRSPASGNVSCQWRGEILATVLYSEMSKAKEISVFVRDVSPERCKLFQVADLACTLELTALKLNETGTISPSESIFFGGAKNFRKNFLKPLRRKHKD